MPHPEAIEITIEHLNEKGMRSMAGTIAELRDERDALITQVVILEADNEKLGYKLHALEADLAAAKDAVIEAAVNVDDYLTIKEISLEIDLANDAGVVDVGERLKAALDKLKRVQDEIET